MALHKLIVPSLGAIRMEVNFVVPNKKSDSFVPSASQRGGKTCPAMLQEAACLQPCLPALGKVREAEFGLMKALGC